MSSQCNDEVWMARDRVIQFRLSEGERVVLERAALVRGESLSDLVRGAALRDATLTTLEQPPQPENDR